VALGSFASAAVRCSLRAAFRPSYVTATFLAAGCQGSEVQLAEEYSHRGTLILAETTLTIPQVDYEPAVYYTEDDPYPHIDFSRIDRTRIVDKEHNALHLENGYIRLTLLPDMGRVYALYYKSTGHDVLWRNDTVTVGGGVNDTGWWIWIGGVEYTLPGDEHGTTWALPWDWRVMADSPVRKTVRMEVTEPVTGLRETLDISLYPESSFFEARVEITNPTDRVVHFAHWVNPQWTPGGQNELTDSTEFIIPTERIVISEKWQRNLGPSPQRWADSPLRFIKGWPRMGDLMADGLGHGFFGAHSHDVGEGVVRVFDREKTPGVDVWTYGYHPTQIPLGSGSPSKGYVEMWGGTSVFFPDERRPLAAGAVLEWTEWMYPYHGTGGLTFADTAWAVNFELDLDARVATVGLCPTGRWSGVVELWSAPDSATESDGVRLYEQRVELNPDTPFFQIVESPALRGNDSSRVSLRLVSDDGELHTLQPKIVRRHQ
jgi:hypothetical protein